MKSKIKFLVVILTFIIFAGSIVLKGEDTQVVKILENPHPFYDAQELANSFERINNKVVPIRAKIKVILQIISKYVKNVKLSEELSSATNLNSALFNKLSEDDFSKNFFLKDEIDGLETYALNVVNQSKSTGEVGIELTSAATGAKGFLQPTMVIDALASFIAERFKEELSIAFLEKFKGKLTDIKNESGLGILFPKTTTFLESFEISDYKRFLSVLKESFQADLNNFIPNLCDYLKNRIAENLSRDKLRKENKENGINDKINLLDIDLDGDNITKKNGYMALFMLNLIGDIIKGKHPVIIIDNLSEFDYLDKLDQNFSKFVRLLAIISRNLKNKEEIGGWIKVDDFKKYISDNIKLNTKEKLYLYIGLLYEKEKVELKDIFSYETDRLQKFVDDAGNDINKAYIIIEMANKYLDRLTDIYTEVKSEISEMRKMKEDGKKLEFEQYHKYIRSVVKLVKIGIDVLNDSVIRELIKVDQPDKKITLYINYAEDLLEISQNIHDKQYGLALTNALDILKDIWIDKLPANSNSTNSTKKEFVKYMSFVIGMANAKDAAEMEKLIEAVALPVGSYRLKRMNSFTISLNAYPGGFLGGESLTAKREEIKDKKKSRWNAGFSAPIGIAFNLGTKKRSSSWSAFLSVIDIGAVVNWRLGGEDKGELPEIKWKNVFAPGFFIIHGLKNVPLSIGVGVEYGPQLRKIKASVSSSSPEAVIESSAFRFGLIIAVDIPIFNFTPRQK